MSLRTLRQHAGLTQSELGKKLNVDHAAVSNWERGVKSPCGNTTGSLPWRWTFPRKT